MIAQSDHRQAASAWGRALALAAAGAASLLLMLYPYVLNGISGWRVHAGLPVMMLGVAGLFVAGLGFRPGSRLLRGLFHPACAWGLFAAGILVMVSGWEGRL